MAIVTVDQVKTFLGLEGQDDLIAALIPEIEGQYLEIRGAPFDKIYDVDSGKWETDYPPGSALTAAQMIGYRMQTKSGGMKSETLGDYSYTVADVHGSYPDSIVGQIRRYLRVK